MSTTGVARQGQTRAVSTSSDKGEVQGLLVKIKRRGDGTVAFDVVCHNSKGRVAHRERLFLPPKSSLATMLQHGRGKLVHVDFERTGKERDRAMSIQIVWNKSVRIAFT